MTDQVVPLRVAIAGGGICGGLLARRLHLSGRGLFEVVCYEKSPKYDGPPGVNLLLNHNGIGAIRDHDEPLFQRLTEVGFEMREWAARTMSGEVLYTENVVASGLADSIGLRARWDHFVKAIREAADEGEGAAEAADRHGLICYNATVESYAYATDGKHVVATVHHADGRREEVVVDLLIACDGRFSCVRTQVEGGALPTPDVMDVANFKFLVPDTTGGLVDDYVRVYNVPDVAALPGRFPALAADAAFASECMQGLARLGVMRMKDAAHGDAVGVYGNVRISRGGRVPDVAKTPDAMRALFTPKGGVDAMDPLGRFLLDALVAKAEGGDFHWERFQEATPRMRDERGHVLIIGDAAHAFCPSLGTGASLAVEDACAAAAILCEGARAGRSVAQMVAAVEQQRLPRAREFAQMARHHARHLAAQGDGGAAAALAAEVADWTPGATGGTLPPGEWRAALTRMWTGWPRAEEAAASAVFRAREGAAEQRGERSSPL